MGRRKQITSRQHLKLHEPGQRSTPTATLELPKLTKEMVLGKVLPFIVNEHERASRGIGQSKQI